MATEVAVGTITVSTAAVSTTFTVSGLAFAPKAVVLFWCGRATTGQAEGDIKWGMGIFTGTTTRRAYTTQSDHALGTAGTDSFWRNDACVVTLTTTGTVDGLADVSAMNSDGFTLIVDDAFAVAQQVGYIAYGGSDITDVSITDFTQPGSTGNQDINVGFALDTGEDDKAIIFLGGIPVAANTANTDSVWTFGVAAGDTPVGALLTGSSVDPADPTVTCSYCRTGESVGVAYNDLVVSRASLTTWLSTGFRLNWAEISGGTGRYSALAIKGGRWFVGDGVTATDTSNHQEATPYEPKGLLIGSSGKTVSTSDTTSATDERIVGATDGTNMACAAMLDKDAAATADCGISYSTTNFYVNQSTAGTIAQEGAMAIVSLDATPGFTTVMTDADTSAAYYFYLGAADTPSTGAIVGTTSITLAPTGVLAGAGVLAGTSTATLSPTGVAQGAAALAGTSPLAFTAAGAVGGAGLLAGASPLVFTPTGAMTGTGVLAGTSAAAFTPSGALTGAGVLAGAVPLTFSVSGTVANASSGEIAGTSSFAFTPIGLLRGAGAVAGISAAAFTPAAALAGAGALAATGSFVFSLAGVLTNLTAGSMTGAASFAFSPAATLVGAGRLIGATSLTISASATLNGLVFVSGTTSLAVTTAGVLHGAGALTGAVPLLLEPSAVLTATAALAGVAPLVFSLSMTPQGVVLVRMSFEASAEQSRFTAKAESTTLSARSEAAHFNATLH